MEERTKDFVAYRLEEIAGLLFWWRVVGGGQDLGVVGGACANHFNVRVRVVVVVHSATNFKCWW